MDSTSNHNLHDARSLGDTVVSLSGADSLIPANGFVISGHGNAKKWINENIMVGSKIHLDLENKIMESQYGRLVSVLKHKYEKAVKNQESSNVAAEKKAYNEAMEEYDSQDCPEEEMISFENNTESAEILAAICPDFPPGEAHKSRTNKSSLKSMLSTTHIADGSCI